MKPKFVTPRDAELLAEAEAGDRVDAGVDQECGDVVDQSGSCSGPRPEQSGGANGEHREQDHERDDILVVRDDDRRR